jgi:hypothetical protein
VPANFSIGRFACDPSEAEASLRADGRRRTLRREETRLTLAAPRPRWRAEVVEQVPQRRDRLQIGSRRSSPIGVNSLRYGAVDDMVRFVCERQQKQAVSSTFDYDLVSAGKTGYPFRTKTRQEFAHVLTRTEELGHGLATG